MPLSVDTIRCVAQHAMTHHNVYNVYFIFFKKMKCYYKTVLLFFSTGCETSRVTIKREAFPIYCHHVVR